MYEHRTSPLAPRHVFLRRVGQNVAIAAGIMAGSLGIGTLGYHLTEGLPWLDSLLNASMILSGMGPADKLEKDAGKIFATCYALYCGVVFLTTFAVVMAPVAHRFLHRFHLEGGQRHRPPSGSPPVAGSEQQEKP